MLCGVCVVGRVGGPKKKKRGCRRLVIVRGRDGATAVSREKVSHTQKIMMGNDGGASCASFVMMVVAMTVNCGGNDDAIDDDNVIRSPSPTGALHRGPLENMFSGLVGPQNRFSKCLVTLRPSGRSVRAM